MELKILTPEDLQNLKQEILGEIKAGFSAAASFSQTDTCLTSEQVCEILGVSSKQFQKYRNERRIAFSQFGRKIYVKRPSCNLHLSAQMRTHHPAGAKICI